MLLYTTLDNTQEARGRRRQRDHPLPSGPVLGSASWPCSRPTQGNAPLTLTWKWTKATKRESQGYLCRAHCSKGVSHHRLHFGRDSEEGRGVGEHTVDKREGFGCALTRGYRPREAGGGQTRSGASDVNSRGGGGEHISLSLVGPKLEMGTKIGEAVSY